MARCLRGEASADEVNELTDLLHTHEELRNEFAVFKTFFGAGNGEDFNGKLTQSDLRKKFETITKRLRDEGTL